MKMVKLKSSTIDSVAYENSTLTVKFKTGSIYSYKDVPEEIFQKICSADSAGKVFASLVRNSFKGTKDEQ